MGGRENSGLSPQVRLVSALRTLVIFGTRPEAIKLAPVIGQCRCHGRIEPIVCTTGQHRELLDQAIDYFDIRPDVRLDLMRPDQTPAGLLSLCA